MIPHRPDRFYGMSRSCGIVVAHLPMVLLLLLPIVTTGFMPPSFHSLSFQQQTQQRRQFQQERFMFTGIVEEMGEVVSIVERDDMTLWDGSIGKGTEVEIQGNVVLEGAYLGCSICVSGVCLTATELKEQERIFKVGLAPETLRRTYFQDRTLFQIGTKVNLERASEIGGRNSGHFVQGHVDGTGTIIDKWQDGDSLFFKIQVDDPTMSKYIVPKGFIAIDGTSLTVVNVDTTTSTLPWFTFMLVDYTQKKIIVPAKDVGGKVNIEVDVLGKYSENSMAALITRLEELEARITTLEQKLATQESST